MNTYYQDREEKNIEFYDCFMMLVKVLIIVGILIAAAEKVFAELTYKEYTANVSAYCPCEKCCGKWSKVLPRRTASGHIIKPGDKFAAAPKNIPFGTMINIPGYGCVPVLDRGGAISGNKLDVYFDSHEAAKKWGRQYKNVKLKYESREND